MMAKTNEADETGQQLGGNVGAIPARIFGEETPNDSSVIDFLESKLIELRDTHLGDTDALINDSERVDALIESKFQAAIQHRLDPALPANNFEYVLSKEEFVVFYNGVGN